MAESEEIMFCHWIAKFISHRVQLEHKSSDVRQEHPHSTFTKARYDNWIISPSQKTYIFLFYSGPSFSTELCRMMFCHLRKLSAASLRLFCHPRIFIFPFEWWECWDRTDIKSTLRRSRKGRRNEKKFPMNNLSWLNTRARERSAAETNTTKIVWKEQEIRTEYWIWWRRKENLISE